MCCVLHTLTAAAFSFQLTERRSLLENDIAPLTQAQATVSQAVTALNQEAGRSEMADGYQKQEIREWYNGTCIDTLVARFPSSGLRQRRAEQRWRPPSPRRPAWRLRF